MIRKLLLGLVLLLLAGCQRDDAGGPDDNRPNRDGSVRFSLRTDDPQTKGIPQGSLEKYDSVCATVYGHRSDYGATTDNDVRFYREITLKPDGANWQCAPPMFWPAGLKLSLFAYASDIPFAEAGISFLPVNGTPEKITYNVPSDVTKQPDLLVTTKFNQTQVNNISLTLKHALSCVSFCGVAPQRGTYVKSITLRNVYSEGTLELDDALMKWTVNPASKGFTAFEPGIREGQEVGKDPLPDKNYLMTEDGYLMMIPQSLADAAIDVLYWNGKDKSENKIITYILPVDDESYAVWEPGKKYIYKFGTQSEEDITVVYYEKYANDAYGLYYYDQGAELNSLDDTQEIVEAGYGVLAKKATGSTVVPIRIISPLSAPVTTGPVVELSAIGAFLYPVTQSGENTFVLPSTTTPVDVYFNGSDKSCGIILPHFAKGVAPVKMPIKAHAIRTPQQMRNISAIAVSSIRGTNTYTQERDLDFSKTTIGGGTLTTSVVNCAFNDLFYGQGKRIENVKIESPIENGALFVNNRGEIKEVMLLNSSITSSGNVGGIAATNELQGVILSPRIMGENNAEKKFTIHGTSGYVGAIVGLNYGQIIGNRAIEEATELPVAEVSGWVSIKGVSQPVGGIVGENHGAITTCLVNGVYVTGPKKGDVVVAKISIEGGDYVGGFVGVNRARVDGNYSGSEATLQAEPDMAGVVSISGNDWVGGIAGQNSGANAVLNQVNIRLGRGNADNAITITGRASVGGIVGFNTEGGILRAEGKSFISVRGNVIITGVENVGGIVGNNQSGSISNCFVYNFYSQSDPLVHHAPKISGASRVGGIVGYGGAGTIRRCAVFSTVSAANQASGNASNARVEISATGSSAGGIVGRGYTGLTIASSYVLGNVKVDAVANSGGIVGENDPGTAITNIHIGNNDAEVLNVYVDLFDVVHLPVRDPRMQTGGGVMTNTSGTPTIVGKEYVGGICGVNWGSVDGVSIKDNVEIGTASSDYVGGIAGANGQDATVRNCNAHNPADGSAAVKIQGKWQVGGIIGLNNGIVENSHLGLPGQGRSGLIAIKGESGVGGIAGTMGGIITGNANTRITDCAVYGKTLIQASGNRAGGIIGENAPTNRVIGCQVIGYASTYVNADSFNYDVTIIGNESVGGIAGTNYGDIHGNSASVNSRVTHTAIIAESYAGGLVGTMKSNKANSYQATLYHCDVSYGVLIHKWQNATGAFVGQIEGVGAEEKNPTLYGTASGGATNRIYTGSINPVRINKNDHRVNFPPAIDKLPFPANPPANGNLWADYQMWNYLYWTAYQ